MLVQLSGRNFGCFRDEFCLSMLASDIEKGSNRGIIEAEIEDDPEPLRLLRIAALYGPNASGKSTIIRAAKALHYLISVSGRLPSDEPLRPYDPFALGESRKQPATLAVKAVIDRRVYDYKVSFDLKSIHSETLSVWRGEEAVVLLDRDEDNTLDGEWTQDQILPIVRGEFRRNALVLSLVDIFAPHLASDIVTSLKRLLFFEETLGRFAPPWMSGDSASVADRVHSEPHFRDWLTDQLVAADVGVGGIEVEEVTVRHGPRHQREGEPLGDDDGEIRKQTVRVMKLQHHAEAGPHSLPMSKESFGTRRLIGLSPMLYDLMHGDALEAAFIDELDASLHPALLDRLIRHFNERPIEKNVGGQLIMAVHETSLMDREASEAALRRDQVYFTEKNREGAARLYSLIEFKERQNINMRRRYLQGRYGALPALGDFGD